MLKDTLQEIPRSVKIAIYSFVVFIGFIIFLIVNPFVIVSAGEKGLVLNWGAVSGDVLDPGLHFRVPVMQKVKKVTIQPIQIDYKITVNEDGAITKDNQTIGVDTTIFYRYDQDRLTEMWREYGEDKLASIIKTSVKESFKEQIGDYTIFEIASTQEKIRSEVTSDIKRKLEIYPIYVTEFRIQNYDWSADFDHQIKQTMVRAQQVKQAEQDLLITEQQANKQVKEAEAQKQAAITKAEGAKEAAALMAEAKALEGEGIRKYNMSVQANMDLEIRLRQLEIEKIRAGLWDGKLVPSQVFTPIPLNLQPNFQTP